MKLKRIVAALTGSTLLAVLVPMSASAATNVVVAPTNTQGWSTADTRPGGAVSFVEDATAPLGTGALKLTTDATNAAKAQYLHAANVPLSEVTNLGYFSKQNSASFVDGAPSFQLLVNLTGTSGFTTFVYEPYENNGTITQGTWQSWDVDAGQMWSSKTVSSGTCNVVNGAGGPPYYTLAQLKTDCPNAVVIGFGVNVGSYNPSYDVEADGVQFNDTAYDFEASLPTPTTKDDCKNDGYKSLFTADGKAFKNQGDCVSYVASKGKAKGNPITNLFNSLF